MGQKPRGSFIRPASQSALKYIRSEPIRPRAKNSQMAVRKILRFSFSRPWAWAWLVSREIARGRPAVDTVSRML